MTEEEEIRFERSFTDDRGAFDTAWDGVRQELSKDPRVRDVVEYGYAAWEQLTPRQRHFAFERLFRNHFECVHRRETEERLAAATEEDKSYLQADDVHWVQDAFNSDGIDPESDDTILPGVLAGPLHRVLLELQLLQFQAARGPVLDTSTD